MPASPADVPAPIAAAPPGSRAGSPTVDRVLRGELCTGCGLCAGIAPDALAMDTVAPGYARPRALAPVTPQAERAIAAACPGARVADWSGEAPHRHVSWGPWRQCLTGFAIDEGVRHQASSGGVLSALLIHALASGLVDRVLHIEADEAQPTRNRLRWSTTAAEVIAGSGSRYAASSPLSAIGEALDRPGRFAFVGKPCDVSALRRLAAVDPRVDARVPLMLSFFCGGLPSHAGADRITRAMGFEPDEVRTFRYRGDGWPGLTRAETHDGRVGTMRYAESWGDQLSKEVQFRCKICPDAVGGVADVACADAWYGGESGYPQFEEQAGRSLILTRTPAGDALLAAAVAAGAVETAALPVADIDLMQPAQARRKRVVAARLAACRALLQPVPDMRGLDVLAAARRASLRESGQNMLGTMRRILQKRR